MLLSRSAQTLNGYGSDSTLAESPNDKSDIGSQKRIDISSRKQAGRRERLTKNQVA
jgi:hypothetical protein